MSEPVADTATGSATTPAQPDPVVQTVAAKGARWAAPVAVVVAAAALAVAVWAARSIPPAASTAATGQTVDDPKAQACSDFSVTSRAVSRQTHGTATPGSDAARIVDTDARLAMSSGAAYLLSRLDPATPADITVPLRGFANDLQQISMYAQAGTAYSDPVVAALLTDAQNLSNVLTTRCK